MTFSLHWLSEERQKDIFALIEKWQVIYRRIRLFRLLCKASTVLVWIEYRIELCWRILFEMWGWDNDVEDVNWLWMGLLPNLCHKANEMHSNSMQGGGFLENFSKKSLLHVLIIISNLLLLSLQTFVYLVWVTIISILCLRVVLYPTENWKLRVL
jgi:hypothetical protein